MKKLILFSIITLLSGSLFAEETERDTVRNISLGEVKIISTKETNLQNAPVSASVLNEEKINQSQILSIKDISGKSPNFFIPDYGSAMSNSPYVRGVGSRYSGQSIALYVDNVPYIEKTAFDFELYDMAQLEILRGPQGTLYGRNSIGGIVNIFTLSPLDYQGARLALTAGNYGLAHAKGSYYTKINNKLGASLSGYYGRHDGFYQNQFTAKSVDNEQTAGGRARLSWIVNPRLKLDYIADYDYVKQGAFPYGLLNPTSGLVEKPSFNDASSYYRQTINNSISARYILNNALINVSLSHQYFDDRMDIDQDFTPKSIFTLTQNQKQNLLNLEAIIKSTSISNYKWMFGVNGFGQQLDMDVPVTFKEDGIKMIFEPIFSKQGITVKNKTYEIPGIYDNERKGGAVFHQSTFDNLLLDGLSATIGIRLDVDNLKLNYNTSSSMDLEMKKGPQVIPMTVKADLIGEADTTFVEVLPKFALKYEWGKNNFVYGSVAKGYKSGGFNIQMISDLVSEKLRNPKVEPNVKQRTMFQPEQSWNYEIGLSNTMLNNRLRTSVTLFYMKINGLQLTEFLASGAGRKLTNAGKSVSKGVELSADMILGAGFSFGLNYGYAHASFKHYTNIEKINGVDTEVDYAGKIVPYAPQHTLNGNLNYEHNFSNAFISKLYGTVAFNGFGKIYWHEKNDLYEDFYGLMDARLGAKKNNIALELWGKNLLNTSYNAFYFESFGNKFFQQGKPLQFGARILMEI